MGVLVHPLMKALGGGEIPNLKAEWAMEIWLRLSFLEKSWDINVLNN